MPARKPSPSKKRSQRVAQPTSKAKAAYRSEMRKNFKILFIVLAVLIGIGFLIQGIVWFNQYNEATDGQKKIEAYLEEKYDQDFIVERPTHKGYGFAIEGVLESVAYPEDNPDLKFTATTNSRGSDDKYPGVFWQRQASDYIKPLINDIYGSGVHHKVLVVTYATQQGDVIKGPLPPLKDALHTNYGSKIGFSIDVSSQETIGETGKQVVAQRAFKLITGLRSLSIQTFHIRYHAKDGGSLKYSYPFGKTEIVKDESELLNNIKGGN